jgi:hypothetical protein
MHINDAVEHLVQLNGVPTTGKVVVVVAAAAAAAAAVVFMIHAHQSMLLNNSFRIDAMDEIQVTVDARGFTGVVGRPTSMARSFLDDVNVKHTVPHALSSARFLVFGVFWFDVCIGTETMATDGHEWVYVWRFKTVAMSVGITRGRFGGTSAGTVSASQYVLKNMAGVQMGQIQIV